MSYDIIVIDLQGRPIKTVFEIIDFFLFQLKHQIEVVSAFRIFFLWFADRKNFKLLVVNQIYII